ncbi:hypothetical protein N7478_007866 [Penicillium angulare]|uniref:uncharacterized protein n=1 Tax=Penicillium angulare TaxID=116970 RepID=UPI00253F6F15|nr:uncharacterized protein N7478_007866 [Penicillium angulare]KAJ5272741.1 hypothetical protein N7478_007866 [Penicillium angulare]
MAHTWAEQAAGLDEKGPHHAHFHVPLSRHHDARGSQTEGHFGTGDIGGLLQKLDALMQAITLDNSTMLQPESISPG